MLLWQTGPHYPIRDSISMCRGSALSISWFTVHLLLLRRHSETVSTTTFLCVNHPHSPPFTALCFRLYLIHCENQSAHQSVSQLFLGFLMLSQNNNHEIDYFPFILESLSPWIQMLKFVDVCKITAFIIQTRRKITSPEISATQAIWGWVWII